jgi:CshA-type fibril repeat protein
VKYVVQDTTGQIAGATVTPTVSLPDPPVATPESKAVIPGGTATFTTVSGSGGLGSSVAGLDTSLTCLFTPGTSICDADGVVTVSGEGTYTLNQSTGVVTFVADVNATQGNKTAVTYQIVDQFGQTATSTLTPVVPAPPVAVNDTSSGEFDTNQMITLLTNDSATSPATLVASSVRLCATTSTANASCTLTSLTVADEGTYTVNTTTGVVTFDPLPTFTGTASPVKYVVQDTTGQIAGATVTPTVSLPDEPTAANDTSSGDFDTNQTITLLTNDSAGSGASLVASTVRLCATTSTPKASCTLTSLTVADEGTYTVNTTTGVVTFDPLPTFTGTASPVKYVVADNFGQKTSATITPTVSLPDPPTAANNTSSGDFDTNQTIRPVTNDSAGSGASLVASSVRLCATTSTANAVCRLTSLTVPGEGTYTVNTTTGVVTFDPLPTFTGTASPVKYVVADVVGQIVHATITPTVGEEELPPTGINAMEKLVVSALLLLTIGLGLNRAKFWAS